MASLTEELILAKTGVKSLEEVLKLNICGYSIEDVSILRRLPNVEVLSLSVNSISSLRDFTGCTMLRELYLRKNALADLAEIRHLQHLPQLKVLWLTDNPCASHPNYREQVLASLPSLVKLDGQDVAVAVNGPARRSASQVSPVAAGVSGLAPSKSRTVNGTPAEEGVDGATTGSMNVLYAVMALLRELDEEGLRVVKVECENRLGLGPLG